jgi:hypothetical protein
MADGRLKILTTRLNVVDRSRRYSSAEWSLPVPLHKSLDLSLLTHRDPFAAHCCPQGVSTDPTGQHR